MPRAVLAAAIAAAVASGAGCLPSTHRIPRGELARLADAPPEERGAHVRVIQDLVGEAPPPAAPVTADTHVTVIVVGDAGPRGRPPPTRAPAGGGGGKGVSSGIAAAKADDARALFVLAAIAAVTLAFTEGARYDGWVRLHPMHPVHLYGPGGYAVVPLAHLDPGTAAWAERAVVRPSEGPWQPLGRAPLDRAGLTYSVLLGAGTVASGDGRHALGTAGRVQLGLFPTHELGVQLDWGFAWRGNAAGETLFDNRLGVELTFAPLALGPLHGGVFGGVALATRFEDGVPGGRARDTGLSGGALVQLELTTRLALTGRFGLARAYDEVTRDLLIGLSVY